MQSRLLFKVLQLRKRLWAKPLLYCLMAVVGAFMARIADFWFIGAILPEITPDTIQTLLTIISSSMLAVATFAVGSMLSAYSSASTAATPRAFALVLADDVSQIALSSFIGAFIFSIVAIVALKTGLYGRGGLFVLFSLTLLIFAWVVLTFVRWVDNIARLGRLSTTIDKAEAAAFDSLEARRCMPFLGGVKKTPENSLSGVEIFCPDIGYVQYIDMEDLQSIASDQGQLIMINAMPGSFLAPGRPLVTLNTSDPADEALKRKIADAFIIGKNRTFEADPRFGLIVLSEIASRALSPGVNDPGTAIVIIGRFICLFASWSKTVPDEETTEEKYDRVIVPALSVAEMFNDAFSAIARDGANAVEVGIRLQKAFVSLSTIDNPDMNQACRAHSRLALERARAHLKLKEEIALLEEISRSIG